MDPEITPPARQTPELVEVSGHSYGKPRPVRAVAELARAQHGVVEHRQLLGLGFSHDWIEHRIRAGWLHIVFRGAYAVGHKRITWRGRLKAATLSCGPDAYVSHRAAAALHGLRRYGGTRIDITAPPGGREDRDGIVVHRVRNMRANETAIVDGIPVTSVARTCLDMAAIVKSDVLDEILEEAEKAGTLDLKAFLAVCGKGRKGSKALKRALLRYQPLPGWTRSRLERRAIKKLKDARIPVGAVNAWVPEAAVEGDIVYFEERLVIEIDGGVVHGTTAAKIRDPQRDAKVQIAGYAVLRVPEHRLVYEPDAFVDDVRKLLSRAGRTPARPGR